MHKINKKQLIGLHLPSLPQDRHILSYLDGDYKCFSFFFLFEFLDIPIN